MAGPCSWSPEPLSWAFISSRYSGASPPTLVHQVIGRETGHQGREPRPHWSSSHKWGRATCPYFMMSHASGLSSQLRGESTAVPRTRELEAGARWQHLILTMGKLTVWQMLKSRKAWGLLHKGRGVLCTLLAKAFREPRKKEKTSKNF